MGYSFTLFGIGGTEDDGLTLGLVFGLTSGDDALMAGSLYADEEREYRRIDGVNYVLTEEGWAVSREDLIPDLIPALCPDLEKAQLLGEEEIRGSRVNHYMIDIEGADRFEVWVDHTGQAVQYHGRILEMSVEEPAANFNVTFHDVGFSSFIAAPRTEPNACDRKYTGHYDVRVTNVVTDELAGITRSIFTEHVIAGDDFHEKTWNSVYGNPDVPPQWEQIVVDGVVYERDRTVGQDWSMWRADQKPYSSFLSRDWRRSLGPNPICPQLLDFEHIEDVMLNGAIVGRYELRSSNEERTIEDSDAPLTDWILQQMNDPSNPRRTLLNLELWIDEGGQLVQYREALHTAINAPDEKFDFTIDNLIEISGVGEANIITAPSVDVP